MNELSGALSVLTAMITPAVLISACGSLLLSTSTRLGRVVDRVRKLAESLEEMAENAATTDLYEERRDAVFRLLDLATSRSRLLQRCMVVFYLALCVFITTSVAIGIVSVSPTLHYYGLPVITGIVGAFLLFYGSVLLIAEARLASRGIRLEMDFTWRLSQRHLPPELQEKYKPQLLRVTQE